MIRLEEQRFKPLQRVFRQQQQQQKSPMTLNQKVVVWARGHLGKVVGAGECWDPRGISLETYRCANFQ
jgi:hypothetical protein